MKTPRLLTPRRLPSAQQLPDDHEAADHPLVAVDGASSCLADSGGGDSQAPAPDVETGPSLADDPEFQRELIRTANGDGKKIRAFLREMGLGGVIRSKQDKANKALTIPEKTGRDPDSAAADAGAPETFFCPISFHLFRDPVLLSTGQTYERSAIERWLAQGTPSCPVTGVMMAEPVAITPNVALRRAIEDWAEKTVPDILGPDGKVLPIPKDILQTRHLGVNSNDDCTIAVRPQEQEMQCGTTPNRCPAPSRTSSLRRIRSALFRQDQHRSTEDMKRITRCLNLLWAITAVHIVVFITTFGLSGWKFEKLDVNPLIGFSASGLSSVGATNNPAITRDNEWWRIIVSMFVNAGFIHLEATLAAVWTFGRFLANKLSFHSIATLYIASGIGGVLVSANFATNVVTAGASGAVFGLMGAVLCELLLSWRSYHWRMLTLFVLGIMASVNVVVGLTPLLDNWCAIGGLACGVLTGLAIMLGRKQVRNWSLREVLVLTLQIVFSAMVILVFVVGLVGLLMEFDGREECSWCSKLTCVDSDWWNCETAAILPDHCTYNVAGNLTTRITCPSGATTHIEVSQPTQEVLEQRCEEICSVGKARGFGFPNLDSSTNAGFRAGSGFVAANDTL